MTSPIMYMVRSTEVDAWVGVGWVDLGDAIVGGWNLLEWTKPEVPIAPFSAVSRTESSAASIHLSQQVDERLDLPSHVYLIVEKPHGSVKVGVADNVWRRLYGLQTGNPKELEIVTAWALPSRAQAL